MKNIDFSYESSLSNQALPYGHKKESLYLEDYSQLPWIEVIYDLTVGAGYSYSRIAYRIKVSPSTIQKLATNPKRKPKERILYLLMELRKKVFQGQYATPKAKQYWEYKMKNQQKS